MRASFVMSGVGQGLRRNVLMSIALIMITFVSLYFLGGAGPARRLTLRSWRA